MWTKLETYYDLDALEKDEKVPFPNETVEFSLPPGWVEDKDSKNNGEVQRNVYFLCKYGLI